MPNLNASVELSITFSGVYTPRFTRNRIPPNPLAGEIVGDEDYYFLGRMPEARFHNGELAARYNRYFGKADIAMYFYRGFYKNPVALDMVASVAYYPRLHVYGASVRLPLMGGIARLESGFYDSRKDTSGDGRF
ncbi:MAG: hypothetical protein PHU88_04855 [candidate division Zixibacteria bacterium]|nr:hypothetical protein [candidate division Zixibacteria bacterium]MDD5426031.1 hypothetical protein [candidate division Zixibacteria bacterium]